MEDIESIARSFCDSSQKRHTLSPGAVTSWPDFPFPLLMCYVFWNLSRRLTSPVSSVPTSLSSVAPMPQDFNLFCGLHGDADAAPFGVKIEKDETVSDLKEYIKDKKGHEFASFDADRLKLWKWNKPTDEVGDLNNIDDVLELATFSRVILLNRGTRTSSERFLVSEIT